MFKKLFSVNSTLTRNEIMEKLSACESLGGVNLRGVDQSGASLSGLEANGLKSK